MIVEKQFALLEEILASWKKPLGVVYEGYKNHVYRTVNFCLILKDCSEEEREKLIIAGAFHDLGAWVENTLDYLPPSVSLAMEYLKKKNLEAWSEEIELMITQHHKITKHKDPPWPLVETFRKADRVDASLGLFKSGIPKTHIKQVKAQFPNADFHKNAGKMVIKCIMKHPFNNPVPMIKW